MQKELSAVSTGGFGDFSNDLVEKLKAEGFTKKWFSRELVSNTGEVTVSYEVVKDVPGYFESSHRTDITIQGAPNEVRRTNDRIAKYFRESKICSFSDQFSGVGI